MNVPLGLVESTSVHATLQCPHCGVLAQQNKISILGGHSERHEVKHSRGTTFYHAPLTHYLVRCVNCSQDTYLLFRSSFRSINSILTDSQPEVIHQYPISMPLSHHAIPWAVAAAAIESEKCLSASAYNACGVMTRRAMHALCEVKGATGRDLFAQLANLKDTHQITPDLWEWAEELRVLGRNGAHPEWEEVSGEDAEYAVRFLREIVRYLFILPSERSERRVKESSKRAENTEAKKPEPPLPS